MNSPERYKMLVNYLINQNINFFTSARCIMVYHEPIPSIYTFGLDNLYTDVCNMSLKSLKTFIAIHTIQYFDYSVLSPEAIRLTFDL